MQPISRYAPWRPNCILTILIVASLRSLIPKQWRCIGLLFLVLSGSCLPTQEPGTYPQSQSMSKHSSEPLLPILWSRLPLLPPDLRPSGWTKATQAWKTAMSAYENRRFKAASRYFLESATALRDAKNPSSAERVSITGRCLAYENAGRALRAARQPQQAQILLETAARIDPACKHSVALRIAHIIRTETSSAIRRAGP